MAGLVRVLGATPMVMRPRVVCVVALVQVTPPSVLRWIWPLVLPLVTVGVASTEATKFVPPTHPMDQA